MLSTLPAAAQDSSTYALEFVRAAQVGSATKPMTVVVLKVTPLVPDFKLVMSMRLAYDIGHGGMELEAQSSADMRFTVYGNDVESKSRTVYEFVKDKVDLAAEKDIYLLRIDFRNLSTEPITDMWLRYGLWEGSDAEVRHEKEFRFVVEDLRE